MLIKAANSKLTFQRPNNLISELLAKGQACPTSSDAAHIEQGS